MRTGWIWTAILAGSLVLPGTPLAAQTEFVYVLSQNATADVSAYTINAATGALISVPGSPFAAGAGLAPGTYSYYQAEIASDPLGRFLFVPTSAGGGRGGVNVFKIDAGGALAAVPGSPFPLNGAAPIGQPRPGPMAADPTGRFLFVGAAERECVGIPTDECGAIHVFSIGSSGSLAEVAGSPYTQTSEVRSLAIDPAGKFLYTRYSAFVINNATGALTPVTGCQQSWGDCPVMADNATGVAMDPRGRFLFKAGPGAPSFRINPVTGELTSTGSPPLPAGAIPAQIAVDPTGRFLYGASPMAAQLYAYRIDEITGALTIIAGTPWPVPGPGTVTVDKSGKFLYVASLSGTVAYSIDPGTGGLTAVAGSPFAAGAHPRSVTTSRRTYSAVTFQGRDPVTQGNWQGVYGQEGKYLPAHYYGSPAYASFRFTNASERLYNYTYTDQRALQMATNPAQRIQSYLEALGTMTFQLNTTDNRVHRVALYFADYSRSGRSVTVRAVDTATGALFDTQVLSSGEYAAGVYLVYLYNGPATLQVINNQPASSGITGMVSGFFWGGDAASSQPLAISFNPVPSPVVGTVALSASTSPQIVKVQYLLDNVPLSGILAGSPFSYPWNSQSGVTNGKHTLCARGLDVANNEVRAYLDVQVNNPVPDYGDRFWAKQTPVHSPGPKQAAAMAYDAARAETVLFRSLAAGSETWVWNGVDWTQRLPAHAPPGNGAMAYDSIRQQIVFFGAGNQTWIWNGIDWTQLSPATSPHTRSYHAMAFDAARGQVVLFGGFYWDSSVVTLNDTWVWDGTNWAQRFPATAPPPAWLHGMVYDQARAEVILFGGGGIPGFNATWAWNGVNWTQKAPATSPPPTAGASMAYHAAARVTVLFTQFDNTTWIWNGITWTQIPTANPGARGGPSMAYDAARMQVVLWGGDQDIETHLNDTWTWNDIPQSVLAAPIGIDTTTRGDWPGASVDGKYIPAHYYGTAPYSSFRIANTNERLWNYTTTDARALHLVNNATQRIQSYWEALGTMSFQLSTTDNQMHSIGIYFCDYTNAGRSVTVKAVDTATGAVLDVQGLVNYMPGIYLRYNYRGPVTIQVINNRPPAAGVTATVSGFFWSPAGQAP